MADINNRDACIACVEQSPQAVAAQDRERWLSLFSADAVVEDPVGSRPNHNDGDREKGALARFYNCFIDGRKIDFHVHHDIVQHGKVMRDLDMVIHMSPSISLEVPMHLLYELSEENQTLKIKRLAAHWEQAPMSTQLVGKGIKAMPVLVANTWKMLRHLGISGTRGFMEGAKGAGDSGKEALRTKISAEYPDFFADKFIAAGNTVTASVWRDELHTDYCGVILGQFKNGAICESVFFEY